MSLNETPRSNRVHISIFGRRNAGKSSLINAITDQEIAVVSPIMGTTTDPVYKSMELLPIGPVVIIDTAGLDDEGLLGDLRKNKTLEVLNKTDLALIVIDATAGVTDFDIEILKQLRDKKIPIVGVLNKFDEVEFNKEDITRLEKSLSLKLTPVSSKTKEGIMNVKQAMIRALPDDVEGLMLVGDLISPGDFVVLVVPIDKGAPKGRLILPQQQTIRDILDNGAIAITTRETELKETLKNIGKKPSLVITDSQAFLTVAADTPDDIPLTSFSILFARSKGDLDVMMRGVKKIDELKDNDKVLVVEGCTHHRQADDIGKVKIPRWLKQLTGKDLNYQYASGTSFPTNLKEFALIIHCGGCMLNHREMQHRISQVILQDIPIINYGILIGHVQGVLDRAMVPFSMINKSLKE